MSIGETAHGSPRQSPLPKQYVKYQAPCLNSRCRVVRNERVSLVLLHFGTTVDATVVILLAKSLTELDFILTRTNARSIVGRV
jgi:hypothetical protein